MSRARKEKRWSRRLAKSRIYRSLPPRWNARYRRVAPGLNSPVPIYTHPSREAM